MHKLYPIIRRQRRPLVEVTPAPVAVKGTNEQVQETEKAQGVPVAPAARASREKKTVTTDSSSSEAAGSKSATDHVGGGFLGTQGADPATGSRS